MILAEMTKLPTNIEEEYVASYLFMHAVRRSKPISADDMPPKRNIYRKKGKGCPVGLTESAVRPSFKKFCNPVTLPPETPHANLFNTLDEL